MFDAPSDMYLSGSRRQAWSYQAGPAFGPPFTTLDGPDEVAYRTDPMTQPMAVVGPITANLFVSATAVDTELFVQLIDEAPDGSRTYLQRGLLKASHRAIDTTKSDYAGTHALPAVASAHEPAADHAAARSTSTSSRSSRSVTCSGPGHRLLVKISAPPILDSFYAYVPKVLPSVNTVFHTVAQPSRLTLPIVPLTGAGLGPELACGAQEAVRCIAAPNG